MNNDCPEHDKSSLYDLTAALTLNPKASSRVCLMLEDTMHDWWRQTEYQADAKDKTKDLLSPDIGRCESKICKQEVQACEAGRERKKQLKKCTHQCA